MPELMVKLAFTTITQENCIAYIEHADYIIIDSALYSCLDTCTLLILYTLIFIDHVPLNYALTQLNPPVALHTHLQSVSHYHGAGAIHLVV